LFFSVSVCVCADFSTACNVKLSSIKENLSEICVSEYEHSRLKNNGPSSWQNNQIFIFPKTTTPTERPPLVGEVIANFCG
jgi:hypothetical protein